VKGGEMKGIVEMKEVRRKNVSSDSCLNFAEYDTM